MVLQCLTCIPFLRGRPVDSFTTYGSVVRPLPDDVIIDILCRLPAESVLTCRLVCRQWRALTSTSYFVELHHKRSTPFCVIGCKDFEFVHRNKLDLFTFHEEAKKDKMMKKTRVRFPHLEQNLVAFIGSCNGLLLYQLTSSCDSSTLSFYACNPVTHEQITFMAPIQHAHFCGFFFHPGAKEYRLLCAYRQGDCFRFMLYSFGSESWRQLTAFTYRSPFSISPIIVNGALYWILGHKDSYQDRYQDPSCSTSIVVFNMDKEDFRFMSHPGYECSPWPNNREMHLLEMKEQLALSHVNGNLIEIWVLEDCANWVWVDRYKVNLDWDVKRFPFDSHTVNSHYVFFYLYKNIRVLSIQNDELLLGWFWRGLFWYNIRLNTVRKVELNRRYLNDVMLHSWWKSFAFTKSIIPMRGFSEAKIVESSLHCSP